MFADYQIVEVPFFENLVATVRGLVMSGWIPVGSVTTGLTER